MRFRIAGGLCCLLLGTTTAAWAISDEGIDVNGDAVEYHEAEQRVVGHGHVSATAHDTTLTCDHAVIYLSTKDAFLNGHVRIVQSTGTLSGDQILYNFETRKGSVIRATGVVGPWRMEGDRADKVADSGFTVRQGYLTTCEFETPHYRIQARQVRIVPGDRVIIKNAVMYLGPVPVFYLPSYVHRLDDRRPHVSLIPGQSKAWGPFLLSSWRYYLHENLQGRINLDYRERRGMSEGIDTKYRLSEDNEGLLRYYHTHEHRITKGHRYSSKKKEPAVIEDRYRVDWRHHWTIDPETTATVELHEVKDDTFLKDYFRREFEQDNQPKTYVQLIRSDPRYVVTFLNRFRVNHYQAEIAQLPEIQYRVQPAALQLQHPLHMLAPWLSEDPLLAPNQPSTNWYYQSTTTYDRLYREPAYKGPVDHVFRFDTSHQVSYQTHLLGALNVTPFIATEETWYSKDGIHNSDTFRGVFETGVDMNLRIFRNFEVGTDAAGLDLHGLRHIITPSLSYRYNPQPTVPPTHLKQFDGIDALDESQSLSPQVEQKLQTKRGAGKRNQLVDLARLVLGTTYNFRTHANSGGRLANLAGNLELKPYPWLLVETDTTWHTHHHQFLGLNLDLVAGPGASEPFSGLGPANGSDRRITVNAELPWAVGLGWRWQRNKNGQITAELAMNLGPKWRLGLYERADVRRVNSDGSKFINRPAESEFRLRRDLHEWTVEFVLSRRRAEGNEILLLFHLKAFPDQPLEFQRTYNRPKLGNRRPLFVG